MPKSWSTITLNANYRQWFVVRICLKKHLENPSLCQRRNLTATSRAPCLIKIKLIFWCFHILFLLLNLSISLNDNEFPLTVLSLNLISSNVFRALCTTIMMRKWKRFCSDNLFNGSIAEFWCILKDNWLIKGTVLACSVILAKTANSHGYT